MAQILEFKSDHYTPQEAADMVKDMDSVLVLADGVLLCCNMTLQDVLWLLEVTKKRIMDYEE